MNRVYLTVPFEEKEQAKRLGARWDNKRRQWYAPDDASVNVFKAWLSQDSPDGMDQILVEVTSIAETFQTCWKCSRNIPVISLASDCHHYFDTPWEPFPLLFSCVTSVPEAVKDCLKTYPSFHPSFSKSLGLSHWRNNCPKCHAAQGDNFLYGEPGDPFFPTTSFEAELVTLRQLGCAPASITCLMVVGQPADLIFEYARRVQ
jgi:hypothetical protein